VRSDALLCREEKRAGPTELPAGKSNARWSAGERLVVKVLRGFAPALDRCPLGLDLYRDCRDFVVARGNPNGLMFSADVDGAGFTSYDNGVLAHFAIRCLGQKW
jgi:hypothetical protein